MRIRRLRAVALGALLAVTVVGCDGASDSGNGSASSSSATTGASSVDPTDGTTGAPVVDPSSSPEFVVDGSTAASASDTAVPAATATAQADPSSPAPVDPSQVPDTGFVPGDINATVAPVAESTLPAEPLEATVAVGAVASARLGEITAITAEAVGPGEVAGPAYRVEVHLQNTGDAPLQLDGVTVSAFDKEGTPLVSMTGPPAEPFAGELAAGGTATAVLVLTHTDEQTAEISVTVSVRAGEPIALFSGTVPS